MSGPITFIVQGEPVAKGRRERIPLAARAQQAAMPTIGLLSGASASFSGCRRTRRGRLG